MGIEPGIGPNQFAGFHSAPEAPVAGRVNGSAYTARIAIPDYAGRIARHYGVDPRDAGVPFGFRHFGVIVEFDEPIELDLYDGERVLDEGLRGIVESFGPLVLRNAYLPERGRLESQRNIFESLRFHIDRGSTQEDCYSLFWRDPFDPAQRAPRSSSTLILANLVAYLQALKEGGGPHDFKQIYRIFVEEDVAALVGEIMVEQPWQAPEGTGEITILDNRSVLHASYYARDQDKGYPIAVRYLF